MRRTANVVLTVFLVAAVAVNVLAVSGASEEQREPLACQEGEGIVMALAYNGLATGRTARAALATFLAGTYPVMRDSGFVAAADRRMKKSDNRAVADFEVDERGYVLEKFVACESVITGGRP